MLSNVIKDKGYSSPTILLSLASASLQGWLFSIQQWLPQISGYVLLVHAHKERNEWKQLLPKAHPFSLIGPQ